MIKPAFVSITLLFACAAAAHPRHARHHHRQAAEQVITCGVRGCSDEIKQPARQAPAHDRRAVEATIVCNMQGCSDRNSRSRPAVRASRDALAARAAVDANGNVVGGRPAGCPYEFCGCEASLYVFGEIRRELNLASAWMRKFPRVEPAAGMAAVRNHHVMILMSHVSGKDWMVHDGNSGNHRTREHKRSISGYVVVDPHGARAASTD